LNAQSGEDIPSVYVWLGLIVFPVHSMPIVIPVDLIVSKQAQVTDSLWVTCFLTVLNLGGKRLNVEKVKWGEGEGRGILNVRGSTGIL